MKKYRIIEAVYGRKAAARALCIGLAAVFLAASAAGSTVTETAAPDDAVVMESEGDGPAADTAPDQSTLPQDGKEA